MFLRGPCTSTTRSRRHGYSFPRVSSHNRNPTTISFNPITNHIPIRSRKSCNPTVRCRSVVAEEEEEENDLLSVELEPIISEQQFNRIMDDSQHQLLILWMATWCRKCIYLKPKLEKLAADYHPRIRFYCIDVNAVPHKLVARAGVTKMPTIQVWKDSKKQAEVIGGHKAYLVINDIREMIEDGGSP